MLQFDVLSILRAHSCASGIKAADVSSAVGELLCLAMGDCSVGLVRVAGQCVRAKHGLHLSFWTSCYDSPNYCQCENCTACSSSFLHLPDLASKIVCPHTEEMPWVIQIG